MASSSETSSEYIQRCQSIIMNGIKTMSINLGNELGLFKALADFKGKPATSQAVADAAGCKERYVREWLNACATADLINIDSEGMHYWLTKDRCDAVTSRQFAESTAMGPFLELFGTVFPQVAKCFKKDGPSGLSYDTYVGFGAKMQNFTQYVFIDKIESHMLPLLSQEFRARLDAGGLKILDVACGTGGTTCRWGQIFPKCEFIGFDFGEQAVKVAKERAISLKLSNIKFVVFDAVKMDSEWTTHFDVVMITNALHDMARPDLCLKEIHRVLKPGGLFLLHDIDAHTNPAENLGNAVVSSFYVMSYSHCTPVSLYFPGGLGLGTCWGREKAREIIEGAGFEVVKQGGEGPPILQYLHALKK